MTAAVVDPRTLACLGRLIAFDTVSRNSNRDCIEWARAHVEAHGARVRLDWNRDRSKVNMFATFGEGDGGIVLSGHVDVVPVDGQDWGSDPFKLDIRDARAYGRGTCDMKGFDACVLAHAPDFGAARLGQPIHIALTCDEELGCLGIPNLIADLARAGIKPAGAIIGEPTAMRLVAAHKGGEVWRCHVTGKAAHSSLTPTAVNAIEHAARIVAKIQDIGERFRTCGRRDAGFDIPFTTISTNLFRGGNGPNIVPAETEFLFDYRYVPGDDPNAIIGEIRDFTEAEVVPRMHAVDAAAGVAFTCVNRIPALDAKPGDLVYRLALDLLADKAVTRVAYGTEASFFEAYGVPSVVVGPGSIQQAHKADEYVALDQLAQCDRFISGLIGKLSTTD